MKLGEVHHELSKLWHALHTEFPNADITIGWRNGIHLYADIEVLQRHKQRVIDQLMHGVLNGPYDYRFGVSYSTCDQDDYRVTVRGYVKLYHPCSYNIYDEAPRKPSKRYFAIEKAA